MIQGKLVPSGSTAGPGPRRLRSRTGPELREDETTGSQPQSRDRRERAACSADAKIVNAASMPRTARGVSTFLLL